MQSAWSHSNNREVYDPCAPIRQAQREQQDAESWYDWLVCEGEDPREAVAEIERARKHLDDLWNAAVAETGCFAPLDHYCGACPCFGHT